LIGRHHLSQGIVGYYPSQAAPIETSQPTNGQGRERCEEAGQQAASGLASLRQGGAYQFD